MAAGLVSVSGVEVPEMRFRADRFLDKTTVLYGPSQTGKTFIIKAMMRCLAPHIDQILVIAPTEPTNESYKGLVPPQAIHYSLRLPAQPQPGRKKAESDKEAGRRFLAMIIKRQEAAMQTSKRASDERALEGLYARVRTDDGDNYLRRLGRKRRAAEDALRASLTHKPAEMARKLGEVGDAFDKMVVCLKKRYIGVNLRALWERDDLTKQERFTLEYLNFNPRLLIVFDDCAAQLKPVFSAPEFRELFYQGRHKGVTIAVCAHAYTDLCPPIRVNAFVNFFTKVENADTFFTSRQNASKAMQEVVEEMAPKIITNAEPTPFRKIAYIREDPNGAHLYHVTAPAVPPDFRFGSPAMWELCAQVAGDASDDPDNPYYKMYEVA